jgi:pimeloyl-ACP methyl ester carboxylesterase
MSVQAFMPGMNEVAPTEVRHGLAVRYWGTGAPLVLLHGGMGSWTHWGRNIGALASKFTVIAIDMPGYGDSGDAGPIGEDGYIDCVAEVFAEIVGEANPAGLVGFSFGAVIAAAISTRKRRRVARLSLLGPGGFGYPAGRSIALQKLSKGDATPAELRKATAFNLGQWMLSAVPDTDDPVVDVQLRNLSRARFDNRQISAKDRLVADLATLTCPIQLIWGSRDVLTFPSIRTRLDRCLDVRPDLEAEILPGGGHWVPYECAEEVNELLIRFHARNSARKSDRQ